MSIIDSIRLSGTTYQIQGEVTVDAALDSGSTNPVANSAITTALDDKQATLVSSQNIKTINNTSILGSGNIDIQGGGKAVSGGTNISVTTGETADTINCTLPISADSKGIYTTSTYPFLSSSNKSGNVVFGNSNVIDVFGSTRNSNFNALFGYNNGVKADGGSSNSHFIAGSYNIIRGTNNYCNALFGTHNNSKNVTEFGCGQYNNSVSASTTFGNSGNTLFSVGNGTSASARHNALEIRQNGDIYLSSGGTDIKLQDHLGGGGSSYTAGDGIDITNNVISVTGKVSTSDFNTYTAATDTALANKADTATTYTKTEVDNAITAATSTKQDTLVSSQNIKTINNESILGSGNIDIQGGGKAIEAGRGISITTGETADTVSFNLSISAGTGTDSIAEGNRTTANGNNSHAEGYYTTASGSRSHAEGYYTTASGTRSHAEGDSTTASGTSSHAEGGYTIASASSSHAEGDSTTASGEYSHTEGFYTKTTNQSEHASGQYNNSVSASTTFGDSGNTLFSVGNGTSSSARHNAFEIRQNGDIYLSSGGTDIKLQDHLGGGGGGLTEDDELLLATALTDLNDRKIDASEVKSNYQKKGDYVTTSTLNTRLAEYETALDEQNVEEVTAYALNDLNERFGGLRIVKISETEYAALTTKDENTLYIVVADPS